MAASPATDCSPEASACISAGQFERFADGHSQFRGFVDLLFGDTRIQTDKLDLYEMPRADGGTARRLVAEGNVVFMRGEERLSGVHLVMGAQVTDADQIESEAIAAELQRAAGQLAIRSGVPRDVGCLTFGTQVTTTGWTRPAITGLRPGFVVANGRVAEVRAAEGWAPGDDLLAYRATEADALDLVAASRRGLGPTGYLIVAGSVNTAEQIRALKMAGADAFTIGSDVFDGSFSARKASICSQLEDILAACASLGA